MPGEIKSALTLTPVTHKDYPQKPVEFFLETSDSIHIPRFFEIPECKGVNDRQVPVPFQPPVRFAGRLRDHQEEPFTETIKHLESEGCGILCLSTGFGKSVIALKVLATLGQKTIIIVHKLQLLHQWNREIQTFLPGLKVCCIHGNAKNLDCNADVFVVTIQTLLNWDGFPGTLHGLTIFDEVHHLAGAAFSRVCFMINSKYMLGLSATPNRKDGLTQALMWHVNRIFYVGTFNIKQPTDIHVYNYTCGFDFDERYSRMMTQLVESQVRTRHVMDIIGQFLQRPDADRRRYLILTERTKMAQEMYDALSARYPRKSFGLFLGSTKDRDRDDVLSRDIIVASYTIFSEGINVPELNTLIMTTPKRDIVQVMGRIYRKRHSVKPIIVDIVDDILNYQSFHRMRQYQAELGPENMNVVNH
ncbi:hypothetical protein HK102_006339 [Quaeritorhiza haematococci]|nr:hypothetical protein HK102_006339 [Quaeritorhiza haematococci]